MSGLSVSPSLQQLQPNIPMFKEAVMYVLPGHLLEPIYHCLYYFEIIQVSSIQQAETDLTRLSMPAAMYKVPTPIMGLLGILIPCT